MTTEQQKYPQPQPLSWLAEQHLNLRIKPIDRCLHAAVLNQKAIASSLQRPDITHICISDEQVFYLLECIHRNALCNHQQAAGRVLTETEQASEMRLREQANKLGYQLPIDLMQQELALSGFETDVVLLCMTSEINTAYERIFAYIMDDMNRSMPCVELACRVLSSDQDNYYQDRHSLGPVGRLQRYGLLDSQTGDKRGLRQELKLAFGVFERLTRATRTWRDRYYDPDELIFSHESQMDHLPQKREIKAIADALANGDLSIVGLWGGVQTGVMDAVSMLASHTGKNIRRMPVDKANIGDALEIARQLNAIMWLDTDMIHESVDRDYRQVFMHHMLNSKVPIIMTGIQAWRPTVMLASRNYAELSLQLPCTALRRVLWKQYLPELDQDYVDDVAARYRFSSQEVSAVFRTAKCSSLLDDEANGLSKQRLVNSCVLVSRQYGSRLAQPIVPKRGPDDLILPESLHEQVMEVARFYRALSVVDDDWGFARISTGGGGIKVLFTGDSGTGKTLAAEVIAKQIGLPMLKVDVAQLISKWVGETEKNIEEVFKEAESSNTVLFFDEADTLFGKRGEISKGSDRYANLEVGYLLQRLEQYSGLAILASNLKDEIDKAFIRRFHIMLHFPRPQKDERLRLWKMSFPQSAPLDPAVNLDALVNLDMTGASIVNATHTAALLAADEGSQEIRFEHITEGIARQFQREARVMGAIDMFQAHSQIARVT
jgi:hypothetical protein